MLVADVPNSLETRTLTVPLFSFSRLQKYPLLVFLMGFTMTSFKHSVTNHIRRMMGHKGYDV